MIYVVSDDRGRTKLGVAADPAKSIEQLRAVSGLPIQVAAIYAPDCDTAGARRIEQEARSTLGRHVAGGDWYDVEPAVAAASITAAAVRRGVKIAQVDEGQASQIALIQSIPAPPKRRITWPMAIGLLVVAYGLGYWWLSH